MQIMNDDIKETIEQLANSLQAVTLLSTRLRRQLGESAQEAVELEAAADPGRIAERGSPAAAWHRCSGRDACSSAVVLRIARLSLYSPRRRTARPAAHSVGLLFVQGTNPKR
jgi:hypothetical protein